ncbi:MAG: RNA methyltransferase [Bacteroidia bacterium]
MKLIRSLNVKKFRESEGLFIAEGEKIVGELLNSPFKIHAVYFIADWKYEEKSTQENIFYEITEEELKKISMLENPNKVLAIAHIPETKINFKNLPDGFTLMLDTIQDPGNLGTIIRTADWFGVKNIICSNESVDAFNSKVVQSSMGSLFRTNLFYDDLKVVLTQIKKEFKIPVYGAVVDGENVINKKLSQNAILIMGNESKGISSELLNFIDEKITIPKSEKSSAESLNVAISTAILCYKFAQLPVEK